VDLLSPNWLVKLSTSMRSVFGLAAIVLLASSAAMADSQTPPSAVFPSATAPFNETATVAGFNPALGTLNSVDIKFLVGPLTAIVQVFNNTSQDQNFTNASASVSVTLTGPTGAPLSGGATATVAAGIATLSPNPSSFPATPGPATPVTQTITTGLSAFESGPVTFTFAATGNGSYAGQAPIGVFFGGTVQSGATVTVTYNYTPPLTLTCPVSGSLFMGTGANTSVTAAGGVPPYTYSLASGTLPAGLSLDSTAGTITGTPTATGSFTVQVKDSTGATAATTCPFTVTAPPPTMSCPVANTFTVGTPVNSPAITVSGGVAPFTFSVVGTLPPGLTLNASTGAITGTPTASGSFSVKVVDSTSVSGTNTCPFTVNLPVTGPIMSCPGLNSFEVNQPVNSPAIAVTGGTGPYTFSVVGTLPPGLTLNTNTGAITGTPTAVGTFQIEVTDSTGLVSTVLCPFSVNSTNVSQAAFLVKYAANLNIGESYIDITNTGANGAPPQGPGFGANVGNLCVNVYTFDPAEELVSCCSCLVTPDQTVNLGVNRDLISKTLTGSVPTSVTVKLLSSLAGGDGTSTNCSNSAATVATANLASGLAAWGTTLHADPRAGVYDTTEAPFTRSTLSIGELATLGGRCISIVGNASGFGICSSCRAGALGASKLAN
jgi:hypothetical protein